MKNNCNCLFERLYQIQENDIFIFGISFFILEIHVLMFVYYANEEMMT